jgi:flagellar biosynthesis protein FlhF
MRIRRFSGPTMRAVLRQVKEALGAEAVILDTAESGGEVVVTAATDEEAVVLPPPAPPARDRELLGEVRLLLGLVQELVDEHWGGRLPARQPEVLELHHRLAAQGVDGVIAAALVRATAERLAEGTPLDQALAAALAAPGGGPVPRRVQVVVGPPGDGKTTTLVKLAAQARRAGRRVAIVGTDMYRVGAAGELGAYARVLGLAVASARDPGELRGALGRLGDAELVLIDTAGVAPGEPDRLEELGGLLEAAGAEAGRTLVVSAAAGSAAAGRAWETFAPLAPDGCVLTKLDLGPAGPALGVSWRRGVPVSHLAAGRRIPDDLEPATPARLARCLLAA